MIETRAIIRKDMNFEGGFKLKRGTVVYVRETADGWLGMFYEHTGSGHGFALNDDQFSILQSGDVHAEYHVWMPDPPVPPEEAQKQLDLDRLRVAARIRRHREEADELQALLARTS